MARAQRLHSSYSVPLRSKRKPILASQVIKLAGMVISFEQGCNRHDRAARASNRLAPVELAGLPVTDTIGEAQRLDQLRRQQQPPQLFQQQRQGEEVGTARALQRLARRSRALETRKASDAWVEGRVVVGLGEGWLRGLRGLRAGQ